MPYARFAARARSRLDANIYLHVRVLLGMVAGLGLTHLPRHLDRTIERPCHRPLYSAGAGLRRRFHRHLAQGAGLLPQLRREYVYRNLAHIGGRLIAMATRNRLYHAGFAVGALLYQASWIIREFEAI